MGYTRLESVADVKVTNLRKGQILNSSYKQFSIVGVLDDFFLHGLNFQYKIKE